MEHLSDRTTFDSALSNSVAETYREEYEKLKQHHARFVALHQGEAEKASHQKDVRAQLQTELDNRDRELATIKGQISAVQKSLSEDVTNWRKKALELMDAVSGHEVRSEEERALHAQQISLLNDRAREIEAESAKNQARAETLLEKVKELTAARSGELQTISDLNLRLAESSAQVHSLSVLENEARQHATRMQLEQTNGREKFAQVSRRLENLRHVRRRFYPFLKELLRAARLEIFDLKSLLQAAHSELRTVKSQADARTHSQQEVIQQLKADATNMQETFAQEKARFEEAFKSHFQKLKTSYSEQLRALTAEKTKQLAQIQFEAQQEISRALEARVAQQRRAEHLENQLKDEKYNRMQAQRQVQELQSDVRAGLEKNLRLQSDQDAHLTKIFRTHAQVQDQAVQSAEEIRELKLQIKEKSERLVKAELELHRASTSV
ncbi:MAG: hypothetical protein EOP09_05320 [Proteobacteria bacterium]|nr:MAG: hypothetical protein EOP09_05320 [Pseudomonadota bacterium]